MTNFPTNHSLKCLWNAKALELKSKDPHSLPPISVPTIIMMEVVLPEDLLRLWKLPPSLMKTSSTWFRDCNLEDWKINEPLYLKTEKYTTTKRIWQPASLSQRKKKPYLYDQFYIDAFHRILYMWTKYKGCSFSNMRSFIFISSVLTVRVLDIDSTIAHKLWLPSRKVAS